MRLLTDLSPLREVPAFRRLWAGTMLSRIGSAMTAFALTLQVFRQTHSSAAVGALGAASLVPTLLLALPAGSVSDRFDRRRVVLTGVVVQLMLSGVLLTQAWVNLGWIWLLYLIQALSSGVSTIIVPAQAAFIPRLVGPDLRTAALALNRIVFQVVLIGGPTLAGLVAAAASLRGCYAVDVASFASALYGIGRLPVMPVSPATPGTSAPGTSRLSEALDGLAFVRSNQILLGAFAADLSATFFGLPVALFPAINALRYGGGAQTLGLLTAAIGVGGLLSAGLAGPLHSVQRPGVTMLISMSVWGLAFIAFALTPSLSVALLALALAGAADTVTVIGRGVIIQDVTPDSLRGRINALDYLVGTGGGQLGALESGAVATITSPIASAAIGGITTIIAALVLSTTLPRFRAHRSGEESTTTHQ